MRRARPPEADAPHRRARSGVRESQRPESPVGRSPPRRRSAIPRRRLVDEVSTSRLRLEYGLKPSVFSDWQKQAVESLAGALLPASTTSSRDMDLERENAGLEARLAMRDHGIVEISEEQVAPSNRLGEP